MSTATAAAVSSAPALVISGTRYEFTCHLGDDGTEIVRLAKLAGKGDVYDVTRSPRDGLVRCSCAHYIYRLEGATGVCKHGTAAIEAGLVLPAAPVPTAEYAAREEAAADAFSPPVHESIWWAAYQLGLEGEHDAEPTDDLTPFQRVAWLDGFDKGLREMEEERMAWSDSYSRMLDDRRDGREDWEEAEQSRVYGRRGCPELT